MTRVVIQARTSSSRLPAKVLLPIAGMPLVVLAARRAGNTGLPVVVATSTEPSDDYLCSILEMSGIATFRGDIDDVLARFIGAIAGQPDDAVIVRLTADNCIPDGALIQAIIDDFEANTCAHLSCNGATSGVPYGVSVELTRAALLRRAGRSATSRSDREHVTPWIIREHGSTGYGRASGREELRATIDYLEDYLRMVRVFEGLPEPVGAHHSLLIARLAETAARERRSTSLAKFVLGGAQLGMPYGITNSASFDPAAAIAVVTEAINRGVTVIDTARAYGQSEDVVGLALAANHSAPPTVVTKLLYDTETDNTSESNVFSRLEVDVFKSLHALRLRKLDTLLLHRADQKVWHDGVVWRGLKKWQSAGLVDRLGVSVQSKAELVLALSDPDVLHIQMPFNILDWRWAGSIEKIRTAKRDRPLKMHIRSSLLQGLLATDDRALWARAGCTDPSEVTDWLKRQTADLGRKHIADLCMAYVRAQDWVDGIVIGNATLGELEENLDAFSLSPLTSEEAREIERARPMIAAHVLDPSTWRKD